MGSRQVFAKGLALTILLFSWPGDRVAVAAALITHPIVPGQAGDALAVDFQGVMTGVIGAHGGGPDDSLAFSGDSPLPQAAGSQPSTGAVGTPAVPAGTARSGTQQVGITGQDPASSLVLGGSPGGSASGARILSNQSVLGGPAVVGQPSGQPHVSAAGGGPATVSGERLSAGKDSGRAALVNPANQVLGDPANVAGSVGSTGVSSSAPGTLGRAAGGMSAAGNGSDSSPPGPTSNSPSNTGTAPVQSSSGATSPAGAGTPTSTPSAGNPSPANGAPGTNASTPSASNPSPANTNFPAPSASNSSPANTNSSAPSASNPSPANTNSPAPPASNSSPASGAPGTSSPAPSVVGSSPAGNATLVTPPAPSSASGAPAIAGSASPQLASDMGSSNGTNTFNQILNAAVLNQVLGGPATAGTAATPASPASASTGLAVSGGGLTSDSVVTIGGLPSSLATDSGKTILPSPVLPPGPNLPLPAIEAGDQVRQGSGVGGTTVASGVSILPAAIPEPSPLCLTVVTVAVCAFRAAVRRVRHAQKGAEAARSA